MTHNILISISAKLVDVVVDHQEEEAREHIQEKLVKLLSLTG